MSRFGKGYYGVSVYGYDDDVWKLEVQKAKEFAEYVAQKGIDNLTEKEKERWFAGVRGFLNYTDLNRIETETRNVALALNNCGYSNSVTENLKINWTMKDFPTAPHLTRVLNNVKNLVTSFYIIRTIPPEDLLAPTLKQIDDLETILAEIRIIIGLLEAGSIYSGTIYCGQTFSF